MLVRLSVNNLDFKVKSTLSILEACQHVGFTIPRFCYHELLAVAGNCRMCLVEIENSPKPVASCVSLVVANIRVFTETPLVKKSRENVIEMLLRNHPLDCPVCDQGGECDLQDQARLFGNNYSRLSSPKRSVENKVLNILIKTVMNRCIHCTRCVRFNAEIAGSKTLGVLGRGKKSEIGLYATNMDTGSLLSEISGNIIDLCPVGALTSKPYAFLARPWELRSCSNIDLTDGLGSNTFMHFKNAKVFRVVPKKNNSINKSLISDKARFFYDSLIENKLLKHSCSLTLPPHSALDVGVDKTIVVDDASLSVENLLFLRNLQFADPYVRIRSLNPNKTNSVSNFYVNQHYSLNKTLLKSFTSYIILISINLRVESSIINAHVRSKFKLDKMEAFSFFKASSQSFPLKFASFSLKHLALALNGRDELVSSTLLKRRNISLLIGEGFNNKVDNFDLVANYLNKLNKSISLVSLNLKPNTEFSKRFKLTALTPKDLILKQRVFAFNLEDTISTYAYLNSTFWKTEFKTLKASFLYDTLIGCTYLKEYTSYNYWFNPYKTNPGLSTDALLWKTWPSCQHYEESGVFVNMEKRPQKSVKVLGSVSGNLLPLPQLFSKIFNAPKILRFKTARFNSLFNCVENPTHFDHLAQTFVSRLDFSNTLEKTSFSRYPNKSILEDFYSSNMLSKNSPTLSRCSRELRKSSSNFNY
jgi:uncharacterized Fe-S cluster protein YjdI